MKHLTELQLNDYVDDALDPSERARCDAHLAQCSACRQDVAALRSVVADVHALPAGVAPRRDLLGGIHAAIDAEQVKPIGSWRTRTLWSMRIPLAAAAIVLIVATAVVTRFFERGPARQVVASQPNGSSVLVSQEISSLQSKYEPAIAELQQLVQTQRANLSPATIRVLEENLLVIDRAIRESEEALRDDPTNEMVNQMLWSAYEKKLELLRRATSVVST